MTKEERRAAMPKNAESVDMWRRDFPGSKVIALDEGNGLTWGKFWKGVKVSDMQRTNTGGYFK
jgi:hypothetical protein